MILYQVLEQELFVRHHWGFQINWNISKHFFCVNEEVEYFSYFFIKFNLNKME